MKALDKQQCSEFTNNDSALDADTINELIKQLDPPWQSNTDTTAISHTFEFENYYQCMAFVNVVAQIAHQQDHHPELGVSYNRCTVSFSTHSANGLTIKDFICAAKINTTLPI